MADTATTRNRFRKPESGQYVNAWAPELNEDFGSDRLDQALDGVISFSLSGSKTLSSTNYETDEARMRIVKITGGTGGTVTIPAVEKWYWVKNGASGNVTFDCGGTTAQITAGEIGVILCDGVNCYTQNITSASASASAAAASAAAALASEIAAEAAQAAAEAASLPSQVGNSGKYLTTNGSTPSWAEVTLGWTQIGSTQTPSGVASSSITSISATYQDLLLEILGLSHDSGSNQTLRIELSGDNGSSWTSPFAISASSAGAATVYGSLLLSGYRKAAGQATAGLTSLTSDTAASNPAPNSVNWRIAAGINAIRLSWSAGNFDAGSWNLWGK